MDVDLEGFNCHCQQKDYNPLSGSSLSPVGKRWTSFYFGVIDKLVSELVVFSCLDPRHFTALDGKNRCAAWRAAIRSTQTLLATEFVTSYDDNVDLLGLLCKVLLTLPVTTAFVEYGSSN